MTRLRWRTTGAGDGHVQQAGDSLPARRCRAARQHGGQRHDDLGPSTVSSLLRLLTTTRPYGPSTPAGAAVPRTPATFMISLLESGLAQDAPDCALGQVVRELARNRDLTRLAWVFELANG